MARGFHRSRQRFFAESSRHLRQNDATKSWSHDLFTRVPRQWDSSVRLHAWRLGFSRSRTTDTLSYRLYNCPQQVGFSIFTSALTRTQSSDHRPFAISETCISTSAGPHQSCNVENVETRVTNSNFGLTISR